MRLAAPFVDDLVEQANRFHAEVVDAVRTLEATLAAERARGRPAGGRGRAAARRRRVTPAVLRIVWDVSPLSVPPTGIGTYVRESLLAAAPRAARAPLRRPLGRRPQRDGRASPSTSTGCPRPIERRHRRVRGAAPLRRVLPTPRRCRCWSGWRAAVDAFVDSEWLYPRQRHGVRVAVVHDLIPLRFPEWTTPPTRRMHLRKLDDVRRADAVVTNSAATARDVAERLGVPAERAPRRAAGRRRRLPHGPAGRRPGPAGGRPYLLAVGTLEPRKNLRTLLDAYAARAPRAARARARAGRRRGLGRRPGGRAGRPRSGSSDDVVRTGYLPQAELPPIVAGARAFCWPTLFEGFGMPVAEALAAGVPVVCSDDPSLDEAAGDAAWRAPARDPEAIGGRDPARRWRDDAERARRIAAGRAHAATLTWEACADGVRGDDRGARGG